MTADLDARLMELVAGSARSSLADHASTLTLETGKEISISTVCRAMRRLRIARKRVRPDPGALSMRSH